MADFQEAMLYAALADMYAVNARVEGMKAANIDRDTRGEAPAYGEKDFRQAEDELAGWGNFMRGIYS